MVAKRILISLIYILLAVSVTKIEGQQASNVTFGACKPGKDSCSECYLTMKKLLLGRDDNILNLSRAFFPPKSNIPEFVTVTYLFEDSRVDPQIWYWSHDSSYLFFQFTIFQYLSLFFGKPAQLFSQEVTLTLDTTCATASNSRFRLLTQRVRQINIRYVVHCVIYHEDFLACLAYFTTIIIVGKLIFLNAWPHVAHYHGLVL